MSARTNPSARAGGASSRVAATLLITASSFICLTTPKALGAPPSPPPPAPHFVVHSMPYPTNFSEANNAQCLATFKEALKLCDGYQITISNTGALKTSSSTPITVKDALPAGLEVKAVRFVHLIPLREGSEERSSSCTLTPLRCEFKAEKEGEVTRTGVLKPDEALEMQVFVTVKAGAKGPLVNTATVSGGGTQEAVGSSTNELLEEDAPFSLALESYIAAPDGTPETQAGGRPYELSTRLDANSKIRPSPESQLIPTSSEDVKDAIVDLPAGLIGSATAAPTCSFPQLISEAGCPKASQVGLIYTEPEASASVNNAIYNMIPDHGYAAEFAFTDVLHNTHAIFASVVPGPEGYVVRASSREIPQVALSDVFASFFGNPAAKDSSAGPQSAMFSMPADCSGKPLTSTLYSDSWQKPGRLNADGSPDLSDPNWKTSSSQSPPVEGCEALEGLFKPQITAIPSSTQSDSPTGLDVNISVPQDQSPETLAVPPVKKFVVSLPQGMSVNASSVNGLAACSLAQVGMSPSGQPNADPPACPDASRIGTVELETPALPAEVCKEATKNLAECSGEGEREKIPLKGSIYVAKQSENPFASLLAIYIVINDPRTGVLVKIPAEVKADEATGQLTTVVDNSPQFPFSELRTHFFSGETASLATPQACGSYTVTTELTPWSAPQSGPPATPQSAFEVNQGAGGGPCANPFAPSFTAGAQSSKAAAFTPFSVSISRSDADQQLAGVSVKMPPGLLGILKSVPRCPEPQASEGNCGEESLIGESSVAVGTGGAPYWVNGGKVYLTGPYNNGPFGLSILTPTSAGPFTLTGNGGPGREIVRASIRVDPNTSQVSVLSDPLPRILQGIPLQIRTVNVTIDRAGFLFNPTNCNALSINAALSSTQGASYSAQSPFQASDCKSLAFKPTFTAQTSAKTSKANGASLKVGISYPPGAPQANIARVDLEIPKILPTRLTTIQKACTEAQFGANPAGCPPASVIATATVHTPLLQSPLTGPAYFVSHGGAAFPDVEMVLQGEGITLIVDGKTQIKNGATFSHFETVPDAPFSSFEFNAPQGPFSIFTANGDLCAQPIKIPLKMSAQNGAVQSQSATVAVNGCSSALKILQKKVKGRKVILKVSVPAAGKLSAQGKGLSKAHKSAKARGTLTLTLTARTKHGRLNSSIRLSFVPAAKGQRRLSAQARVRLGG